MRMPSKTEAVWKKYPLTGFLYADEAFSSSLMVKWVTHCVLRKLTKRYAALFPHEQRLPRRRH
jgi:hypothetical protein